ncbi:MAG: 3-isopropylmalate dehydratase [Phycisphaeraceae bacterium]|nr:3-isopropylmalate dehydratase [Phycisphaeraceae bacterium]
MPAEVITGKAFVLGDDVDTDQIIPAEYLSYNPAIPDERRYFGMHALSGVPAAESGLPDGGQRFVEDGAFESPYRIIIGGRNFGCGSSREHAPLALAEAGARVVVAEFYARIFFRNCVNGGYLLPCECTGRLVDVIRTGDECEVDAASGRLTHMTRGATHDLQPLGDVQPIIDAGGIFDYAKQAKMF